MTKMPVPFAVSHVSKRQLMSNVKTQTVRWKGVGLPVGIGVLYLGYLQYKHNKERELQKAGLPSIWPPWKVWIYRSLPLNTASRWWGWLHERQLPVFLRKPILGSYCWYFGCNLDEAVQGDLEQYPSLGSFFRRAVRPDVRPIANELLVSPADGKIMNFGPVDHKHAIEQVKGITYKLDTFFGPDISHPLAEESVATPKERLFQVVVYLAPGDYHGFHSPVEWTVNLRRHFPGILLSVGHLAVRKVPQLFCLNERVLLFGRWKYGFFSFCAVAATNVGNIRIDLDPMLKTNQTSKESPNIAAHYDRAFANLAAKKGDKIGEFNLGSTVVLIFEAPENFKFLVQPGQKIKYGEPLGHVS